MCRAPADGSQAAMHPTSPQHLGQHFCGIHMLLYKAIISHFRHGLASQSGHFLPVLSANRLLPAILMLASVKPGWILVEDSAAVPWMQHRRMLFCITWLFIWGLWFFLSPVCFQVSEWKFCSVCALVMFWEKRNFCVGEKKEGSGFLKLRFPCPKTTDFLWCHKITEIKWTQSHLNFCPASLYWELANHEMKMNSFLL